MTGKSNQFPPINKEPKRKQFFWLNLVIIQSILIILWLLLIPKEPGNAQILGYSLRRLALLIPLILPLIGAAYIKWGFIKFNNWNSWITEEEKKSKTAVFLTIAGFLMAIITWSIAFLFFFMNFNPDNLGAYVRFLPLLICYFLLAIEFILFVVLGLYPIKGNKIAGFKRFSTLTFLIPFGVLISGLIVVMITGWGVNPERVSIISLGSPLLEGQIWYITGILVLLIGAAFAWSYIPRETLPISDGKLDLIIAIVLWVLAVSLWMSLPLPAHNYFAPAVQPPNFEKYPFSDAEQYDFDSLNVYYGSLAGKVISKPLYVSLLALLHTIAGLNYDRIILLQTLIVALFPVVLFLIGKELHSRLGGIAIALFAILREVTAIQATSMANVASTKLLLSDMPACLLASVIALMFIRWFKTKGEKVTGHEFIVGGLIGSFILIRIQTIALIPLTFLFIIIRYFRSFKSTIISFFIFLIAIGLVISPVLIRNHSISGVYWVDNPSSSAPLSRILTQGMQGEEELNLLDRGNEVVTQNTNLFSTLIFNNFDFFANFTFDNFSRNEISSFLILPVRLGNQTSFLDYVRLSQPFWVEVYSKPNLFNLLVILINFGLLSLGFSSIFRLNPWASVTLISLHFIYSLSSAIARLSGWRFIIPVDWLFYALFALGLVEFIGWIFRKFAGWNISAKASRLVDYPVSDLKPYHGYAFFISFGLLFLLIGAAIPLREYLLPSFMPEYTKYQVCQTIEKKINSSDFASFSSDFSDFCMSDRTRTLYGFGIYPRYFKSGEGFYNRSYDPWFGEQPYARLVFRIIGTENGKVYIKSDNEMPRFPNGALVYAVGIDKAKFEAQVVLVEGKQPELIISSTILSGQQSFATLNK
jgi:hypothetical protein